MIIVGNYRPKEVSKIQSWKDLAAKTDLNFILGEQEAAKVRCVDGEKSKPLSMKKLKVMSEFCKVKSFLRKWSIRGSAEKTAPAKS